MKVRPWKRGLQGRAGGRVKRRTWIRVLEGYEVWPKWLAWRWVITRRNLQMDRHTSDKLVVIKRNLSFWVTFLGREGNFCNSNLVRDKEYENNGNKRKKFQMNIWRFLCFINFYISMLNSEISFVKWEIFRSVNLSIWSWNILLKPSLWTAFSYKFFWACLMDIFIVNSDINHISV